MPSVSSAGAASPAAAAAGGSPPGLGPLGPQDFPPGAPLPESPASHSSGLVAAVGMTLAVVPACEAGVGGPGRGTPVGRAAARYGTVGTDGAAGAGAEVIAAAEDGRDPGRGVGRRRSG